MTTRKSSLKTSVRPIRATTWICCNISCDLATLGCGLLTVVLWRLRFPVVLPWWQSVGPLCPSGFLFFSPVYRYLMRPIQFCKGLAVQPTTMDNLSSTISFQTFPVIRQEKDKRKITEGAKNLPPLSHYIVVASTCQAKRYL